jgi:uncharacterized protein (DUF427 family)
MRASLVVRRFTATMASSGPKKESVWDYPRPPRLEKTLRHLTVKLNGTIVADTKDAYRVLETSHPPTYYIPRSDIDASCLSPSPGGNTMCEWKGSASYWDVRGGDGQTARRRAWSYETPTPEFAPIAGHIAFYASPFECSVDGEVVQAQPGTFYGGWMTSDIDGGSRGVKGGPGTWGW